MDASPPYTSDPTTNTLHVGDIFWLQLATSGHPHPCVVIHLDPVIICPLTSNLKRAKYPGNVLLDPGEGNLHRQSVVEVAKVTAVEPARLGAYIGALCPERIAQIEAGILFVQTWMDGRKSGV